MIKWVSKIGVCYVIGDSLLPALSLFMLLLRPWGMISREKRRRDLSLFCDLDLYLLSSDECMVSLIDD